MRINARDTFGFDLSEEEAMRKLAKMFPILTDGVLEIDFCQCLIDYKATSILMDAALSHLEKAHEPRHLIIIFNVKFHERLLLKWLFFGSAKLGLDVGALTDEEIRDRINCAFVSMRVSLTIKIAADQAEYLAYSIQNGH